jgi:hypothetical protein
MLPHAAGVALLLACLVRSFESARARLVVAAVMVMVTVSGLGVVYRFHHSKYDLRGAMTAVRAAASETQIPVLICSPFPERRTLRDLSNPNWKEVLFAPEFMYPAAGRIVYLPHSAPVLDHSIQSQLDESALEGIVDKELAGKHDFFFVAPLGLYQEETWMSWLMGRLQQRKPVIERLGAFGLVAALRVQLQ